MCGIFFVAERGKIVREEMFSRALAEMTHRGPDGSGIYRKNIVAEGVMVSVALGHVRLAIIDPSESSKQPFHLDETVTIFNGEIFNYQEIKRELSKTCRFQTTGDTEVLAQLLNQDGLSGLQRALGQWAFVQLCQKTNKIIFGRDFFGKKPLFLFHDKNTIIMSSTVRSIFSYLGIRGNLTPDFTTRFLTMQYPCLKPGESCWAGIKLVPAGHVGSIDLVNLNIQTQILPRRRDMAETNSDRLLDLPNLIASAVERRLVSDRPVGLLLSGGIDSTLILSVLKSIDRLDAVQCFAGNTGTSADFEVAIQSARAVGARVSEVSIGHNVDAFDSALKIFGHQERPFRMVGNLVGMWHLYKAISESDVKVVLDGTGADEIFGGYWDRQFPFALRQGFRELRFGWLAEIFLENIQEPRRLIYSIRQALKRTEMDNDLLEIVSKLEVDILRSSAGNVFLQTSLFDVFFGRLQDWLWQNDRNSMSFGLEARSPFLDRSLEEYISLNYSLKFKGRFNKKPLRDAFASFVNIPAGSRVQKQGLRWQYPRFWEKNSRRIWELCSESLFLQESIEMTGGDKIDKNSIIDDRYFALAALERSMNG